MEPITAGLFLARPLVGAASMAAGKKGGKTVKAVSKDKELVKENIATIDKLKIIFETNTEICDKLNEIKSAYEFASPKKSKETASVDKRIGGYLEDIELCAKKSEKNDDFTEIETLIKKIRIAIAER